MLKTMPAILFALLWICGAAGAWTVDPNLVSSTEYPATGDTCALASNTATGKMAVLYWSPSTTGDRIIYSEKNPSTGVWSQEAIVTLDDSETVDYERGSLALDLTPDDRPIILYSYLNKTLSGGVPTSVESVNKICEKAATGTINDRVVASRATSPADGAGAFGNGLFVGDADNIVVVSVLMYAPTPEAMHQYLAVELLGDAASSFPRKSLLYEIDNTVAFGTGGMVAGGGFTWDAANKARLMLGLSNTSGAADLNYYGYITQTQTTERDFPLNLICSPTTTTNSTFGLLGIISAAFSGTVVMAPDSTGCLHIVYIESGSDLIRYATEAEPLSLLWLDSSVNADNGRPAVSNGMWGASYEFLPLLMTCRPAPRVVMAERNTATSQYAIRVAAKGVSTYQWTWGPRLEVPCYEYQMSVSKNGDAVAYYNGSNQIQVALP